VLIPFKGLVFHVLYGGKYTEVAHFIPYVALGTTLWAAAFGPAILLRAIESPDSIFYARIVASVLVARRRSSCHSRIRSVGSGWQHHHRQPRGVCDFDVHPVPQVASDFDTEPGSAKGKARK